MILQDRDVLDCPIEELADTRVLKTWPGGRAVFAADATAIRGDRYRASDRSPHKGSIQRFDATTDRCREKLNAL